MRSNLLTDKLLGVRVSIAFLGLWLLWLRLDIANLGGLLGANDLLGVRILLASLGLLLLADNLLSVRVSVAFLRLLADNFLGVGVSVASLRLDLLTDQLMSVWVSVALMSWLLVFTDDFMSVRIFVANLFWLLAGNLTGVGILRAYSQVFFDNNLWLRLVDRGLLGSRVRSFD